MGLFAAQLIHQNWVSAGWSLASETSLLGRPTSLYTATPTEGIVNILALQ